MDAYDHLHLAGEYNSDYSYDFMALVHVFTDVYCSLIQSNTQPLDNTEAWLKIERRTPRIRIRNSSIRNQPLRQQSRNQSQPSNQSRQQPRNEQQSIPRSTAASTLSNMLGLDSFMNIFQSSSISPHYNNDQGFYSSSNSSNFLSSPPNSINFSESETYYQPLTSSSRSSDIHTTSPSSSLFYTRARVSNPEQSSQDIFNLLFDAPLSNIPSMNSFASESLLHTILNRSMQEQNEAVHPVLQEEIDKLPKIIYNVQNIQDSSDCICSICQSLTEEDDNNEEKQENNQNTKEEKKENNNQNNKEEKKNNNIYNEKVNKEENDKSKNYILVQLPCGHEFHSNCITTWFQKHNTCCVCRYPLLTTNEEYNKTVVQPKQLEYEKEIKEFKIKQRMKICTNLYFQPEEQKDCYLLNDNTQKITLPTCQHIYHIECLQSALFVNKLPPIDLNLKNQEQSVKCPYCKKESKITL